MKCADFLIIGAGIIGLSVALELRRRSRKSAIVVIDKESGPGAHASGRNSGVLHAGFYYTADSLKARFCRQGNISLRAYIQEKGLPLNECGKLVVAKDAGELPRLDELLSRGRANGVPLESVTAAEAREIEPRAVTHERAIWSPTTATADPVQVIEAMRADAIGGGIEFIPDCRYLSRSGDSITTSTGSLSPGYVINCAGLYADSVARDFGFAEHYHILPFKGLYLYANENAHRFHTNIYPVPDLRNPFLGVHFTVTVDGTSKIGPTAIPALWREQYGGLTGLNLREFADIAWRSAGLFLGAGFDFRTLALEEMRKQSRKHLIDLAGKLASDVRPEHYTKWGRPGIRAQLIDKRTQKLEMDFVLEADQRSLHILNAVSPAWTCALPFASHVCDQIALLAHAI